MTREERAAEVIEALRPVFRIVNTDNNYGSYYPNESFTDDDPEDEASAQQRADELNGRTHGLGPRYFKVVTLPYTLQPGFEP